MIEKASKCSWVFWQMLAEDVGEPAILIAAYSDCISLRQEGRTITISRNAVAEFLKAVKAAAADKESR